MKKILLIVLVFVATAGVAYAVISRGNAKAEVKKECCAGCENCVCTDCACADACCAAEKCNGECSCGTECQEPAAEVK